MALIKNNSVLLSGVTTAQTSSAASVSDAYVADVYVSIWNSGAATTGGSVQLQFSPDSGTNYYNGAAYFGGLTSNITYYWVIAVPSDATHIKIAYAPATGTTSVCTAQLGKITSV